MQRDHMTKTIPELTDEMVDRAEDAFCRNFRDPKIAFTTMHVRGLLEAALTPEPEIEVTEAMKKAGADAYQRWWDDDDEPFIESGMVGIYRAMVKAAPKEGRVLVSGTDTEGRAVYAAKSAPQGVSAGVPEKATGRGYRSHERKGDLGFVWHRRSTDPK